MYLGHTSAGAANWRMLTTAEYAAALTMDHNRTRMARRLMKTQRPTRNIASGISVPMTMNRCTENGAGSSGAPGG